ncbi:polysaccharide pyruvyl transferase family protein [Oerskovia sp. NPDC060338]|uniref:polysaccharide pyruvyl transferase family protein n=1 Tax=Oerskovia sp. NPDC060338 TaxID=3347100 RepID=UPI003654ACCE
MERRVIYLVGVAGNPNYGDELIARTWLEYLAVHHPNDDVWFDTPHPGPAAALLAGLHPRLRVTDTMWRLRDLGEQFGDARAFVLKALHDPGHAPWWAAGIDVLRSADIVHIIGGGYLNELWSSNFAVVAGVGWLAENTGARTALSGAGLTPLSDGNRNDLVQDLSAFDVVDVRDIPSALTLADAGDPPLGAQRTADDVFLSAPYAHIDSATADLFDVGIVLQDDLVQIDKGALRAFIRAQVEAWGTPPDRIAFIECIPRIDASSAQDVGADWPGAQFYPFQHLWNRGFPAGAHQRWISTRFHPHLLAARVGARGIAISVHEGYYDTKHRSLVDLGSGWAIVGSDLAQPTSLSVGTLAERSKGLQYAKEVLARSIYGLPDQSTSRPPVPTTASFPTRIRAFTQQLVPPGLAR